MSRVRLTEDERRDVIVEAARRIARERGKLNVTHGAVASRCTVPTSVGTVRYYFPTKVDLMTVCDDAAEL